MKRILFFYLFAIISFAFGQKQFRTDNLRILNQFVVGATDRAPFFNNVDGSNLLQLTAFPDSFITRAKITPAFETWIESIVSGSNITNNPNDESIIETVPGELGVNTIWADTVTNVYRVSRYASLNSCIADVGSEPAIVEIDKPTEFSGTLVILPNIQIRVTPRGLIDNNASSDILEFSHSGQIIAGQNQCFEPTVNIEFTYPRYSSVNVRWWGAKGDGTDQTSAFQKAHETNALVYIPAGVYYTGHNHNLIAYQAIIGDGIDQTFIHFTGSNTPYSADNHVLFKGFTLTSNVPQVLVRVDNKEPVYFERVKFELTTPNAHRIIWSSGSKNYFYNVEIYNDNPISGGGSNSCYGGFTDGNPDSSWWYSPRLIGNDYTFGGGTFGYVKAFNVWIKQTGTAGAIFNQYNGTVMEVDGGKIFVNYRLISHDPPVVDYITTRLKNLEIVLNNAKFLYTSENNPWADSLFIENCNIYAYTFDQGGGEGRAVIYVDSTYVSMKDTDIYYRGPASLNGRMFLIRGISVAGSAEYHLQNVRLFGGGMQIGGNTLIQANGGGIYNYPNDSNNTILLEAQGAREGSEFRNFEFINENTTQGQDGSIVRILDPSGPVKFKRCDFFTARGFTNAIEIQTGATFKFCDMVLDGQILLNSGSGARSVVVYALKNLIQTTSSRFAAGDIAGGFNSLDFFGNYTTSTDYANLTLNTGSFTLGSNTTNQTAGEPINAYDGETILLLQGDIGVTESSGAVSAWKDYTPERWLFEQVTTTEQPTFADPGISFSLDDVLTLGTTEAASIDPGQSDFSIEMVIEGADYNTSQFLLSKRNSSTTRWYLRTTGNNLNFYAQIAGVTVVNVATSGGPLVDGQKHYFCLNFDRDGVAQAYLDGQAVTTVTTTMLTDDLIVSSELAIGARATSHAAFYTGLIYEAKISHVLRGQSYVNQRATEVLNKY